MLDAYWFAHMFLCRALKVAADANCTSTIVRRLEFALGRVIRSIGEAADGAPQKADARLARAREAIHLALIHFDELSRMRSVRSVVIVDLRHRASLLLDRLEMLKGKAVETWAASNYLATVVDEVKSEAPGDSGVDVVSVLEKLPAAAVRDLPQPVVAQDHIPRQPANGHARGARLGDGKDGKVTRPPT